MRNLLFRNLTSSEKGRKIISSTEIVDKAGVRNIIQRHFVYIIKEIKESKAINSDKPTPYLYILKEHNKLAQREKFFCRIKASLYIVNKGRLFLILFMHSLKISLTAIPQSLMKYTEENNSA